MEDGHQIGGGQRQCLVPVARQSQVRLIAQITNAWVVELRNGACSRFGAGVVNNHCLPFANGLGLQTAERRLEVAKPSIKRHRKRDPGRHVRNHIPRPAH